MELMLKKSKQNKSKLNVNLSSALLEFVELKQINKEDVRPIAANIEIIMSGGYLPVPEENPSKRYFKNTREYLEEDPRKTGLKSGLSQLTIEQLQRVIDYPGEMVLDSVNYENGNFCALAIGVGLDQTMIDPSHEKVFQTLTGMGYNVYNTRGISGNFYTTNRRKDLIEAAREVLAEKRYWACNSIMG